MIVHFHRNFKKRFQKLKTSERLKLKDRLELFLIDTFNPVLNNHPLKGKYVGYRSINIGGDLRAIYKQAKDVAIFVAVDKHSHLYR